MKCFHILVFLLANCILVTAQNIGIGTNTPHASAALEVKASNKGFLIPRTSTASRTAIVNPAKGLLVYDTTSSSFWYYDPGLTGGWNQIGTGNNNYWSLGGNVGTNPALNFLGTTDASPIIFKVNNVRSGIIDSVLNNSAFGFRTLDSVATGSHNVALGYKALTSNKDGLQNTAIGSNALRKNTSGLYNTAVGMQTLTSNIDGSDNTGVGILSLFLNTSGSKNIAIGPGALFSNTTADNNTSIGFQALNLNSTGFSNVAVGMRALHLNTTKSNLVAIGDSALFNNGTNATTSGHAISNTALGSKALFSNTIGSQNVAVGFRSQFQNNTGDNNNSIGTYSLFANSSGSYNTASGSYSLQDNTSGSYNNAIGSYSLFNNTSGNSNIAIGQMALVANTDRSNLVAIGDSALFSNGLGVTQNFHATRNTSVGSKTLYSNTTGYQNTAVGSRALYNSNSGYSNTAIGFGALDGNGVGNDNTAIGAFANVTNGNLVNATAIGANAVVGASNSLVLGNKVNVGIGTSTPAFSLDIINNTYPGAFVRIKSSLWSGVSLEKGLPTDNNYIIYRTAGFDKWTLGTNGSDNFSLANFVTSTEAISVNASNNYVGIGNTAPASKLHIQSPNIANVPSGDIVMARYWAANNDTRASSIFHYYNSGNASDNLAFSVSGEGGSNSQPNAIGQIKMNIQANGRVGIGTILPTEKLDVVGLINAFGYRCRPGTSGIAGPNSFNINWTGASAQLWVDGVNIGTFSYTSDRRLKEEIKSLDKNAITRMQALNPVQFDYKKIDGTVFAGYSKTQEGFIADELQQVIPSAVNGEKNELTAKGTIQPQTVNIIPIVAVLTKAMQEQQLIIDEQNAKLKSMQADIDMLKKLLSKK